jgi:hypothetical protein
LSYGTLNNANNNSAMRYLLKEDLSMFTNGIRFFVFFLFLSVFSLFIPSRVLAYSIPLTAKTYESCFDGTHGYVESGHPHSGLAGAAHACYYATGLQIPPGSILPGTNLSSGVLHWSYVDASNDFTIQINYTDGPLSLTVPPSGTAPSPVYYPTIYAQSVALTTPIPQVPEGVGIWLGAPYPTNGFASTPLNSYFLTFDDPAPTPTPTPTPAVHMSASPATQTVTVGTPFTVDVVIDAGEKQFNAAEATVAVSPNLTVTDLRSLSTGGCNFQYTETPTKEHLSFAGAIFSTFAKNCIVYRLTLTPRVDGNPGTVTVTNAHVKSFTNPGEELNPVVTNGSYIINEVTAPTGTTFHTYEDSIVGTGQNQWNFPVADHWSHCTNCYVSDGFSDNSISWTNTAGDTATFTFTGQQVRFYGFTDPQNGKATVQIDNGPVTTIDMQGDRHGNILFWTSQVLSLSTHTLTVKAVGPGYIGLDRIEVAEPTSAMTFSIDSYPLATYASSVVITGTKDSATTHILVGTSETGVSYPDSTHWQVMVSLPEVQSYSFSFAATDGNGTTTASRSITIARHTNGDINGDGVIDLLDASLFAVDWGKTGSFTYPLSDMNGDGTVNLTDFSILASLIL